MRISFDIDDTLILYDKARNGPKRLLNGEFLRDGTLDLLKHLQKTHELWLYTSSLRTPWLMKLSFRLRGVEIARVIDRSQHRMLLDELELGNHPTKYPSKFDIDLHVDDSYEVVAEGEVYGFKVLRIDPYDENWAASVKLGILEHACQSGIPLDCTDDCELNSATCIPLAGLNKDTQKGYREHGFDYDCDESEASCDDGDSNDVASIPTY